MKTGMKRRRIGALLMALLLLLGMAGLLTGCSGEDAAAVAAEVTDLAMEEMLSQDEGDYAGYDSYDLEAGINEDEVTPDEDILAEPENIDEAEETEAPDELQEETKAPVDEAAEEAGAETDTEPPAEPQETVDEAATPTEAPEATLTIDENGTYDSKDEVALYIYTYGHLPSNYITKKEAEALGWSGGSLEPYAPGKSIGGSYFGNYEGLLPQKDGRSYTECDIDTAGASSRGAKRIVFSNDGLIYYTEDHYESFTLLYGDESQ